MVELIEGSLAAIVWVVGIVVGSFLNVCIYRFPLGLTVVAGRSFCPACRKTLAWYDMVPVLSFLFLRGRCRWCGAKISPRYPAVELLNGLLWLACWRGYGCTWKTAILCLLLSALTAAAFIDHDTGLILDRFPVFLVLLAAASLFARGFPSPLARLGGMLCVSVPMLLAAWLCGGFGGGDVKLCAAYGLLLGWKLSLLAMLFASLTGAAWGLYLVLRRGAGRKTAMAFGPFLAFGMGTAALWGERILAWYLGLFGF